MCENGLLRRSYSQKTTVPSLVRHRRRGLTTYSASPNVLTQIISLRMSERSYCDCCKDCPRQPTPRRGGHVGVSKSWIVNMNLELERSKNASWRNFSSRSHRPRSGARYPRSMEALGRSGSIPGRLPTPDTLVPAGKTRRRAPAFPDETLRPNSSRVRRSARKDKRDRKGRKRARSPPLCSFDSSLPTWQPPWKSETCTDRGSLGDVQQESAKSIRELP